MCVYDVDLIKNCCTNRQKSYGWMQIAAGRLYSLSKIPYMLTDFRSVFLSFNYMFLVMRSRLSLLPVSLSACSISFIASDDSLAD